MNYLKDLRGCALAGLTRLNVKHQKGISPVWTDPLSDSFYSIRSDAGFRLLGRARSRIRR